MKVRSLGVWVTVLLLLVNLCVGYRLHSQEAAAQDGQDDVYRQIDVLMEVIQAVRTNYVDADRTAAKDLFRGAIRGVLRTLDPFSAYLDGESQTRLHEETEGEFGGIGVQIDFKRGRLVVVAPIDGTPAYRAGLRAGDVILKVDGEEVAGLGLERTVAKMRGKPGTTVRLLYTREGFSEPREVTLERAMIPIHSVTKATVVDGVGYVRLTQFMEKTAEELKTALEQQFSGEEVRGLVIDLRDNPGGLLVSAVEICSYFLPEGSFVVSVEGRQQSVSEKAKGGYKFRDIPLVLLVNGGSASAAEIMSGCLQAQGRAVVVGEKTFGKGSVQSIVPLSNGSELKLTMAYYFVQPQGTPDRRRIHGNGILPDVELAYSEEELDALEHDYEVFKAEQDKANLSETERLRRQQEFLDRQTTSDKVYRKGMELAAHPERIQAERERTQAERKKAEQNQAQNHDGDGDQDGDQDGEPSADEPEQE